MFIRQDKTSFDGNCQEQAVPASLKQLVSLILYGPDVDASENHSESDACLTISQLILFNMKKKSKVTTATHTRHKIQRAPPLPLYVGLRVHSLTCNKTLFQSACYC